jgi:hypothetical protein
MASLEPGPRDHLITLSLRRSLDDLDPEVIDEGALDAAEAPDRLARHAAGELRRDLAGDDSADGQAERTNAALYVPWTDDLRRAPRRAPGFVHVAAGDADAGGAVRGGTECLGGVSGSLGQASAVDQRPIQRSTSYRARLRRSD